MDEKRTILILTGVLIVLIGALFVMDNAGLTGFSIDEIGDDLDNVQIPVVQEPSVGVETQQPLETVQDTVARQIDAVEQMPQEVRPSIFSGLEDNATLLGILVALLILVAILFLEKWYLANHVRYKTKPIESVIVKYGAVSSVPAKKEASGIAVKKTAIRTRAKKKKAKKKAVKRKAVKKKAVKKKSLKQKAKKKVVKTKKTVKRKAKTKVVKRTVKKKAVKRNKAKKKSGKKTKKRK